MGGHCTASVAYVEGAAKVVTGESSVPICVGEKDDYEEKAMGQPWVIVSDKRLYFFNCDATWIFSKPKDYVDTGSKEQLESITALEANWLSEFGSSTDGPFNAADTPFWLMGEAILAHGAGLLEEPHDACRPRGPTRRGSCTRCIIGGNLHSFYRFGAAVAWSFCVSYIPLARGTH